MMSIKQVVLTIEHIDNISEMMSIKSGALMIERIDNISVLRVEIITNRQFSWPHRF